MTRKPMVVRQLKSTLPTRLLIASVYLTLSAQGLMADSTWVYAVQISATVQTAPPQISLTWIPDMYGALSYAVYRKAKEAKSWGDPVVTLDGSVTNFIDTNVSVGGTYEYAIVKAGALGYFGYGYIFSGIAAPLTDIRGKLVLLVETNATAGLDNELARLESDLVGDGWQVMRHGVSSNDTPNAVKALIVSDYQADPANVNAAFLFGHVPILHSGNLNYDGHYSRPMPADAYYGDMDGDWSGSPDYLPSDVELEVGRVDLFNMPGNGALVPWPNETELLRNYLNKDHNWRFKLATAERRALMADRFGDSDGETRAATGYRNFEPFFGHGKIYLADVADSALPENRWISLLSSNSYVWTYACGGGGYDYAISTMGFHGQYFDVWSTDIVGQDAQAVFFMLEGSHFGNWDFTDNILRSVLATPTHGLATCCIAGHPHWFVHHMGVGETIGYGTRLTMNNSTMYQSRSNAFPRAVYIALMGDPTLRLEPLAPPKGLSAVAGSAGVSLNWLASTDNVAGYHVYRADTKAGPFTRLTDSLVTNTTFADNPAPAGNPIYMVRAVALQTNPSGSYFNPSQGIYASVGTTNPLPPITVSGTLTANGLRLTWLSQPGTAYRVLATSDLRQPNWQDVSGSLTANGSNSSWTDSQVFSSTQNFYRVVSP